MLNIFYCRGIRIKTNQIEGFCTSNGNMKYNFIGVYFTRNVSLKHPMIKILLSSLGISFKLVLFKIKILLILCQLTFKFKYWSFFSFFFFESVSASSMIVRLILKIWENNPCSRPTFWIDFLTSTGIKCETLNSCLYLNINSFGNWTSYCLNYSSSMTS